MSVLIRSFLAMAMTIAAFASALSTAIDDRVTAATDEAGLATALAALFTSTALTTEGLAVKVGALVDQMQSASLQFGPTSSLASTGALDVGSAQTHLVQVTGTNTVNTMGSSASTDSPLYLISFAGVLTLTDSSSLILHGGTNRITAADDMGLYEYVGSGVWRERAYWRAVADTVAADISDSTPAGRALLTAANAGAQRVALSLVPGTDVQAFDSDLAALAANASTGLWAITGAGAGAVRTLTAPAAGLSISNPGGVAGNPTFALANDLSALEALGSTGIAVRTAADTWAQRTIAGTSAEITVTNGDGVSGNPTLSLPTALTFTSKTVTGGTFASGAFNGTLGATTPAAATVTTFAASGAATLGGGSLALNNGTSNVITTGAGSGAPTFTTRSVGTKLVLGPSGSLGGATTEYSIGIDNDVMWFDVIDGARGYKWYFGTTEYLHLNSGRLSPSIDNTLSSANGSFRWSAVYAATGTINTSDARDKTLVESGILTPAGLLTPLGLAVWGPVAAKAFQWNNAIAVKGVGGARIHFGWIAQDVEAVFRAQGLDPAHHAVWCADLLTETVRTTSTCRRPVMEDYDETVQEVTEAGGQVVVREVTRAAQRVKLQSVALTDANGDPMMRVVTPAVPATQVQATEAVQQVVYDASNGNAVASMIEVEAPVFDPKPVVDAAGAPIMDPVIDAVPEVRDEDGKVIQPAQAAVHRQRIVMAPRMVDVPGVAAVTEPVMVLVPLFEDAETHTDTVQPLIDPATGEQAVRYGLRIDQCLALEAAYHRTCHAQIVAVVAAQDDRITALENA